MFDYGKDGAHPQARATLAYLSHHDGIEESWDTGQSRYMADVKVDRWHNCREQGYVISLTSHDYKRQINIAFFEHRNSDDICAILWEQRSMNPLTIDTADFGNVYKDKYDTSHNVSVGMASEMADWVYDKLTDFWKATS